MIHTFTYIVIFLVIVLLFLLVILMIPTHLVLTVGFLGMLGNGLGDIFVILHVLINALLLNHINLIYALTKKTR